MRRREFLRMAGAGVAGMAGAAAFGAQGAPAAAASGSPGQGAIPSTPQTAGLSEARTCELVQPSVLIDGVRTPLPLVRAQTDRIISLTVCTRPFRASGPRIEAERLGRKTIVHNYGHGGSGWSLSWGSGKLALRHVLATREREVAVIGCGIIGLTSALLAQRAGLKVRIYAKELPPETRSTFATGNWSPSSRFCSFDGATPEVVQRWEEMARTSFRTWQHLLGLPGRPVEWFDGFRLSDHPFGFSFNHGNAGGEPAYPDLEARIRDITPRGQNLAPGTHPFPMPYVRRYTNMIFNISSLSRMLVSDFQSAGGIIETREFEKPADVSKLREKTVINATGYGARALFGDESVIPVRGQLMRLIPQPEVTYGLSYDNVVYVLPRRDGIVLQSPAPGDFNNADATPDRAAADRTVQSVAALNERIRANLACV